jgi:DNA-directed RNA polymerase specialized sigma subunit
MPDMLEDEFRDSFGRWAKEPDPVNTGKFLKSIDPVLQSALRTFGGRTPSPVLHSHAKLLALHAASNYDPSRAKLRTHLMTHLQGLRRLSARENQIVSIPERVGLDLHHLHITEEELRDKLGREPSTSELADHSGISVKRIGHIRKARPGFAEGQMVSDTEEGGEAAFQPAVLGQPTDTWHEFVYHDLDPIDQLIMEHTLGMHGRRRMAKQAIARKLRLSPGAISQRAARIQQKLDQKEDLGVNFF